ncbi:MAG: HU family DNA-binding protein [Rhodospirillales bacterium]|nr:HU family DNA-binding protein [Rhodospirillales bacterium]
MNKEDLIEALTNAAGMTKAGAGRVVDSVIDTIIKSLSKGEEVRLPGFGAFVVTKRAASMGRNPRTGAAIQIPASKNPKFRAAKALKDAVN